MFNILVNFRQKSFKNEESRNFSHSKIIFDYLVKMYFAYVKKGIFKKKHVFLNFRKVFFPFFFYCNSRRKSKLISDSR